MIDWILGIPIGIVMGTLAVFFAQGGFGNFRLYCRLSAKKGNWHQQRIYAMVAGVCITEYCIWLKDGLHYETIGMLLLLGFLLTATLTDTRKKQIHLDSVIFYSICLLLFRIASADVWVVVNGILGAMVATTLFGIPRLLRPSSVGSGDVLLVAVCGLASGTIGILYLLFRSMLIMLVYSLVQLLQKKVNAKTRLPFAPFLFIGALL